jgi:hypothetical protein
VSLLDDVRQAVLLRIALHIWALKNPREWRRARRRNARSTRRQRV